MKTQRSSIRSNINDIITDSQDITTSHRRVTSVENKSIAGNDNLAVKLSQNIDLKSTVKLPNIVKQNITYEGVK
jgi:hypothetical protein